MGEEGEGWVAATGSRACQGDRKLAHEGDRWLAGRPQGSPLLYYEGTAQASLYRAGA